MRRLYCCTASVALMLSLLLAGCTADPAVSISGAKEGTSREETTASAPPANTPAPTGTPLPPIPTTTPTTGEDKQQYSVYLSDSGTTITFKSDGTVIPQEEQFVTMYDVLTGEPMLLTRHRTDVDELRSKDGYPVTHHMMALYDLDGKLLYDWAEYAYSGGFGDYIIREDGSLYMSMVGKNPELDQYSALWNYKTGEDLVPEAERIGKLDDHTVLLNDIEGGLVGVVETGGAEPIFRPAPHGYRSASGWNGYIYAKTGNDKMYTLMDISFKPILTKDSMNAVFYGLRGNYLLATDESNRDIALNEKGEVLFTSLVDEEDIVYFDGELVGIQLRQIANAQRTFTSRLVKVDGTELAGGYDRLAASNDNDYSSEQPAPYFIGTEEGTVDILDRSGKVTATREIPTLDHVGICTDGFYSYTLQSDQEGNTDVGLVGILDSKLNVVIPADKYTYIESMRDFSNGKVGNLNLLKCQKTASGGVVRWDIVDLSGRVLIENLAQVGDAGPNRIAVVKGFNIGLMDMQGNWITKQSIFDKLEDEKEDIF